jgi:hypothetical protein
MNTSNNPMLQSLSEKALHKNKYELALDRKQKKWFLTKSIFFIGLFAFSSFSSFAQLFANQFDDCNNVICKGGSDVVTLTAINGIAPYSFNWIGSPSVNTTNTINLASIGTNPSSYNTNILGSHMISCQITDNTLPVHQSIVYNYYFTVVAAGSPFPSVSLNKSVLCPYDTVKVTPNSNTNIIHFNSCATNGGSPSGSCYVVPSVFPANYTLTLSDIPNTCNTDVSFTLNQSGSTTCFASHGYVALSPFLTTINSQSQVPTGNIVINHNISIAANISLNNKTILMAPGVKITVLAGATLNISGSYLHACNCMWYGIEADGNAIVNVSNESVIEDAIYAISTDGTNALPTINVTNTLFNKNETGIFIKSNTNNLNSNVSVSNSIFTCRHISSPSIRNNPFAFNILNNNFKNNYLTLNSFYPTTITAYNHQSNAGMLINNVASVSITGSNVFDYLYYGILAVKSNITVNGNQFQNMSGEATFNPSTSTAHLTCTGVGIYADNVTNVGSNNLMSNSINLAGNYFYNVLRGVDIYNYLTINVGGSFFINTKTSNINDFVTGGNWVGQYGVQVSFLALSKEQKNALPSCDIYANTFNYTATGIHIMRSYYNANHINITCNEVGGNSQYGSATAYLNQGISVEDVTGSASSNIPATGIYIAANNVYNAIQNCIYASNVKKGLFIFWNGKGNNLNSNPVTSKVSLSMALVPSLDTPEAAAIQTENCQNGSIRCNEHVEVYYGTPAVYTYGILVDNSPNMTVADNYVLDIYNGICFRGACNPSTFNNCDMRSTHFAFVLDNSSIGTQGSLTHPVSMFWKGSVANNVFTTYNTNLSPDPNSNSKLFMQSNDVPPANKNVGSNVSGNCAFFPAGAKYIISDPTFPNCVGLFNTGISGSSFTGCQAAVPVNGVCGLQQGLLPSSAKLSALQMADNLSDTSTGSALAQMRVWHNKRFLWERIFFDTLLSAAPANVQAFYNANLNSGLGKLALTDNAINQNNTTAALSYNSFTAANNFELKQQQVNGVKIKMADTTGTMPVTAADISTLQTIANGCPETDGRAFYEARSMLNLFYGQAKHYTSNCASGNQYRLQQASNSSINEENSNFKIYPNPNSGSFTLNYDIKQDATLYIFDVQGKQVYSVNIPAEQKSVQINNLDLQNGMYMYKVLNNGTMLNNGKLIILK